MDAREPKEVEDERTAIFVKGTHTGEVLNTVMKDLVSTPTTVQDRTNLQVDGLEAPLCHLLQQKERYPTV